MIGLVTGVVALIAGISTLAKKEKFKQWIAFFWATKAVGYLLGTNFVGVWVSTVSLVFLLAPKFSPVRVTPRQYLAVSVFAFLPALAGSGYSLVLVVAGIAGVFTAMKDDCFTKAGFAVNALVWALFDFSLSVVLCMAEVVVGIYGLIRLLDNQDGSLFILKNGSGGEDDEKGNKA